MIRTQIRLVVVAVGMHLSSTVIAADFSNPNTPHIYHFVHNAPLDESVHAPGSDTNVFRLTANVQCDQSAYLTLIQDLQEALGAARALNYLTGQPAYVYEVGGNPNIFSLRRTVAEYAPRVNEPYRTSMLNYMNHDFRRFTPFPILPEQVRGVFEIAGYSGGAIAEPEYVRNPGFNGVAERSSGVYRVYPEPRWEETEQYIRYIHSAQGSTVDVCVAQSFTCPSRQPSHDLMSPSNNCIPEHKIEKSRWNTALAYELLPVLFESP